MGLFTSGPSRAAPSLFYPIYVFLLPSPGRTSSEPLQRPFEKGRCFYIDLYRLKRFTYTPFSIRATFPLLIVLFFSFKKLHRHPSRISCRCNQNFMPVKFPLHRHEIGNLCRPTFNRLYISTLQATTPPLCFRITYCHFLFFKHLPNKHPKSLVFFRPKG